MKKLLQSPVTVIAAFAVIATLLLVITFAGPGDGRFGVDVIGDRTQSDPDAAGGSFYAFGTGDTGGSDGSSSSGTTGGGSGVVFFDDFTDPNWEDRYDLNIFHRDDVLVSMTSWPGDHQSTGANDLCGAPEDKRTIQRGDRESGFNFDWIYRCVPGGDLSKAHLMTSIGDTSGYSIGSFTPKSSYENIREIRWDVNATNLGGRQFTETKIIPADQVNYDNLPCVPDLPCKNSGEFQADYDDLGAVATATISQYGTGLYIATPEYPDGLTQDRFSDLLCPDDEAIDGYCFSDYVHGESEDIRTRYTNFFRDNGDGTLTFGVEREDGTFRELTTPGSFPSGPVKVIFADHNYTPNKDLGPTETYTWHWDNISIELN